MVRIFLSLKSQYLKTEMGYTANFWMMLISGVITRIVFLAVPFVIYRNIPSIAGWQESEVYLIISFAFLTEGICNLFFEGIWEIPSMVFNGKLDIVISRPLSPLIQVLANGVGLQGISTFIIGFAILAWSLIRMNNIRVLTVLLRLLFIVCGTGIRLSVYIITNSFIFWYESGGANNIPYIAGGIGDYAKYPIDIYPVWMQIVLLFVIPFGFIGFVPALILRGEHIVFYSLGLIFVSAVFFFLACMVFKCGLKKYESIGM